MVAGLVWKLICMNGPSCNLRTRFAQCAWQNSIPKTIWSLTVKKILILESDRRTAKKLADYLAANGYDVLTAPNAVEGLQVILDQSPDLIICEVWMPVGVGFSLAQRLRDLGLDNIPIIFMTNRKEKDLRETARQMGAADFFEKPCAPETILASIGKALFYRDAHQAGS